MGTRENERRADFSMRCAWCGLVRAGAGWMAERRTLQARDYSHGICQLCAARLFAEALLSLPGKTLMR